jgi:hypothetical protein
MGGGGEPSGESLGRQGKGSPVGFPPLPCYPRGARVHSARTGGRGVAPVVCGGGMLGCSWSGGLGHERWFDRDNRR